MRLGALFVGLGLVGATPVFAQSTPATSSSSSARKKKSKARAAPPPDTSTPSAPPDVGVQPELAAQPEHGEQASTPAGGPAPSVGAADKPSSNTTAPAPASDSDDLLGPPPKESGMSASGAEGGVTYTDFPNHKRIDPGLGIWILGDTRGYQGLDGEAAAAGLAVGYSWDLVTLNLVAEQAVAVVGEKKPTFAKFQADVTFFTLGNLAGQIEAGLAGMINGPLVQTDPARGPNIGPEVGVGLRYRFAARVDLVVLGNADVLTPLSEPRRAYFNPGIAAGLAFYPFGGGG